MSLTDQHKALLITFLITGTVILSVFNFGLNKQKTLASESYYEIEPEKELTKEENKTLEQKNNTKAETNKAYNETKNNKHFAQAYKTIAPPEDYVTNVKTSATSTSSYSKHRAKPNVKKIDKKELSSFDKVNSLLKKQKREGTNTKSTISYSLVNRTHSHLPTPVYLCEVGGKIVINITVNANGNVTDAYVNSSSTSSNECLIEHALEYAKNSQFNTAPSKPSQIGSITFYFIGKQ